MTARRSFSALFSDRDRTARIWGQPPVNRHQIPAWRADDERASETTRSTGKWRKLEERSEAVGQSRTRLPAGRPALL